MQLNIVTGWSYHTLLLDFLPFRQHKLSITSSNINIIAVVYKYVFPKHSLPNLTGVIMFQKSNYLNFLPDFLKHIHLILLVISSIDHGQQFYLLLL